MRSRRRGVILAATLGAGGLVVAAAALNPRPLLLWNETLSAPRGLYVLAPARRYQSGDLVAARLPPDAEAFASERGYLPAGLPVIKTTWAVAGDPVCAVEGRLSVPGRPDLQTLAADSAGRPLPAWSGCRALRPGEILLISDRVADSFDGRYFGPVSTARVLGRARLLWPREGDDAP